MTGFKNDWHLERLELCVCLRPGLQWSIVDLAGCCCQPCHLGRDLHVATSVLGSVWIAWGGNDYLIQNGSDKLIISLACDRQEGSTF
jgi:hypothetical protein